MSKCAIGRALILAGVMLALAASPGRAGQDTTVPAVRGRSVCESSGGTHASLFIRLKGTVGSCTVRLGAGSVRWRRPIRRWRVVRERPARGWVWIEPWWACERWRLHLWCEDWDRWEPPCRQVNVYKKYIIINEAPPRREEHYEVLKPQPPPEEPAGFVSTLSPLLGGPDRVGVSFAIGEDYLRRGMFEEAEENFRRAALDAPDEPVVAIALAIAQLGRGDTESAAETLLDALARHPDPDGIRLDLRPWLGGKEAYRERLRALDEALSDDPSQARLHFLRGFLSFADADWQRAVHHFALAEALEPTSQACARMRALALSHVRSSERPEGDAEPAAAL